MGVPSVTVFLRGEPLLGAHPALRHRAVAADVACAPCPHLVGPIDCRCADSVTPGDVVAAVRAVQGSPTR